MRSAQTNVPLRSCLAVLFLCLLAGKAAAFCDPQWLAGTGLRGIDSEVRTLIEWDPDGVGPNPPLLVAGGSFSVAGNAAANNIACFNPSTLKWSKLGSGMTLSGNESLGVSVDALAVLNGVLYAAGNFVKASGNVVNHVARWDPETQSWQALGTGLDDSVFCLTTDGQKLYVGGSFTTANGIVVNHVACWDPTTSLWAPIGQGFDGPCCAIVFVNGVMFASGEFTWSGTTGLNNLAMWDSEQCGWTRNNGTLYVDYPVGLGSLNGKLYIYGGFTNVGGLDTSGLACYNPQSLTWSSVPDPKPIGMSVPITFAGKLYATGQSEDLTWGIHAFDSETQTWTCASADLGYGTFKSIGVLAGKIIGGGDFETVDSLRTHSVAAYDLGTATWSSLGSGNDGRVNVTFAYNGGLYVGGEFNSIGGINARNLAVYDSATSTWSAMGSGTGGTNGAVHAINVWNSKIYVGGSFTQAGTTSANAIACWDPATSSWSSLLQGLSGGTEYNPTIVKAICAVGTRLYVGGHFTTAGTVSASNIACYEVPITGARWTALTTGTDGTVKALATYNNKLYVGGAFNNAGGYNYKYLAVWTPTSSSWSLLGSQPNSQVNSLAVLDTKLYVGGSFNYIGSTYFAAIANWDFGSASWINMGNVGGPVVAMTASTTKLYVGGAFNELGGSTTVSANNIACWSPAAQTWTALGDGLTGVTDGGAVYGLAVFNNDIWAGGAFTKADAAPSPFLARFSRTTPADCDCDLDVDGDDVDIFHHCNTGSAVPYDYAALPAGCDVTADASHFIPVDFDEDGDVDQDDFGTLQRCYKGNAFADPACGK